LDSLRAFLFPPLTVFAKAEIFRNFAEAAAAQANIVTANDCTMGSTSFTGAVSFALLLLL
jgi:hypothetical protein